MLNMFNAIAVLNRVPTPSHLFGIPAKLPTDENEIDLNDYLPNEDDLKYLSKEMAFLMSRDLVRCVKVLSWAEPHVDKFITHDYMIYTTSKSSIVSSGLTTALHFNNH